MKSKIPIIAIIGPTGVGKTALSIRLAKSLRGEVVSVDSIQVYKDASIMSGAATPQEMGTVKHHLLNYLDTWEEPQDFVPTAIRTIQTIHERGNLPILCGGSLSLTEPLLFHPFVEQQELFVIFLDSQLEKLGRLTDCRIDGMVADGIKDEVRRLYELEKQITHIETTNTGAWKSIGYPELRRCCEEPDPQKSDEIFQEGVKVMKENTRAYFLLQLQHIWTSTLPKLFRRQRKCCVFNVDGKHTFKRDVELPAIQKCENWLSQVASST
jgi:tRNA A37 N6-isopentenylltransferase MiaA